MNVQRELERLRTQIRQVSSGFTPGQKAVTILGILALVVGGIVLARQLSRPTYSVLYSGLAPSDAAAVTAKLQSSKVPYQLTDGGQTILVPAADVNQERIDLAEAGLPSGGTVGLSLLDKEGITTSQFVQQADYQRALQGELASTIESIHGVEGAQVDLALPTTNVFSLAPEGKTTASVLVDLAPGASLSSEEVQAIVHLVSSAIPNLAPGNVTVVDQNGDVLAAPGLATGPGGDQSTTQAYDAAVAGAIQSMLAQVVGVGHAVVVVHASLNFNKVTTTSQSVQTTPKGVPVRVPISTQTQTQKYTGTAAGAGGVLGTPVAGATNGQNGTYTNNQATTSYAVGKVTQVVDQAPGTVTRMSVAVLLDSRAGNVPIATVRQLVSAAAGIVPARGDVVSVARLPFSQSAAKAAQAAAKAQAAALRSAHLLEVAKTAGLLVLAALAVLLLWRSTSRGARAEVLAPTPSWPLETGPTPAGELAAGSPASVEDLVEEQPDEVARLLRGWMNERVGR